MSPRPEYNHTKSRGSHLREVGEACHPNDDIAFETKKRNTTTVLRLEVTKMHQKPFYNSLF